MRETKADEEALRRIVRDEIEAALNEDPAAKRAAIIASKGTLDWAYPPLILSTAAAAAGMDVSVFFTFHGLNIVHKDFESKLEVSPAADTGAPAPASMPDIVTALPGMTAFATGMMKSMFKTKDVGAIRELLTLARESGVRLIACRMTMEVFGYKHDELIEGVELGVAASFLSGARKAHLTLFV